MPFLSRIRSSSWASLAMVAGGFAALLGSGSLAHAQTITTLYWDTDAAVAGSGTAGGDWNTSDYWTTSATGEGTTGSWATLAGSLNDVYFSAGSSGAGGFGVVVQNVFGETGINKIVIEEGPITLTGQTSSRALAFAGVGEIEVASGHRLNLSVRIAGSVGLTKTGAGSLEKTSVSSYTGTTWVKEGTFRAGNNVIPDASAVLIDAGATLTYNVGGGRKDVVGSLAGAGTLTMKGASDSAFFTSGGDNTSTTFSGLITSVNDTGWFVKEGSGTLTLSGTNNYKQETRVTGGTLLINGNQSNATGPVTVAAGARLGGLGTVGGAMTVLAGGTLAAGDGSVNNGIGSLSLNGLTLADGAIIDWNVESLVSYDQFLDLDGTLTLPESGTIDLVINGVGTQSISLGDEFTLFNGALANFSAERFNIINNSSWTDGWQIAEGSLVVIAVPEPSVLALLVVAGAIVSSRVWHWQANRTAGRMPS